MFGKLYLVATPIGNLEDISLRAIRTLKEVDLIAAEDTRHTLKLLNHFEISKPLISYYKHNEKTKSEIILNKILNGENIALVSDAGTPGISDPGEEIVKEAIANNIEIVPIPGACAMVSAVICSGFSTREICFIGFLPTNNRERKLKLNQIKNETKTIIIYEAPHKLKKTLEAIKETLGNREVVLSKELTKIHEEFIRGSIDGIISGIPEEIKGEYVIVIKGAEKTEEEILIEDINNKTLEEHYEYYKLQGLDKREIIKQIAKDRNVNKNEIYQYFLK